MTIDEAIEVLELHNQWRKGAEIPMESTVRLGMDSWMFDIWYKDKMS